MPEAVQAWVETKDPRASYEAQKGLTETNRDFPKYERHQLPYLDILFHQISHFIGKPFKYSAIHGEYKKRELVPASIFCSANAIHKITHSAGNGSPLGAEANLEQFKTIFLDVGLSQSLLGLDLASWFLNPDKEFVNRGAIAEAFVGQELLAYSSPRSRGELYFWKRDSKGSLAEVDYLYGRRIGFCP